MAQFHHHPDGLIFIRGDNIIYSDTIDNFITDLGSNYEFTGRERLYEPGVRHFIDDQPQELFWEDGDNYISLLTELISAQNIRKHPVKNTDDVKTSTNKKLTSIIAQFSADIFADGDVNKVDVFYTEKQRLIHDTVGTRTYPTNTEWNSLKVPVMCEDEHKFRMAKGKDYADAGGQRWYTPTPLDLFKSWYINTYMADWLRGQADMLRQDYEDLINAASNETDVNTIIVNFKEDVSNLPIDFITNELSAVVEASGLKPL